MAVARGGRLLGWSTCALTPSHAGNVGGVHPRSGRVPANVALDVLDDTRIHRESYNLARKMAADALDVEVPAEDLESSSEIVEQLFERGEPERCVKRPRTFGTTHSNH